MDHKGTHPGSTQMLTPGRRAEFDLGEVRVGDIDSRLTRLEENLNQLKSVLERIDQLVQHDCQAIPEDAVEVIYLLKEQIRCVLQVAQKAQSTADEAESLGRTVGLLQLSLEKAIEKIDQLQKRVLLLEGRAH